MAKLTVISFVILLMFVLGSGSVLNGFPPLHVEASSEDEDDVPDTPKHDTDGDGKSDDQDTDDDNDNVPDQQDDDDDNDNVPDKEDTDDDNDKVPDDTDADDDNDNIPDDQDSDDDSDGIPDEDEVPTPTPIPVPLDDNGTIPADDNGTIPIPTPTGRNDTQGNGTQPNADYATLSIKTVLRANCSMWHPCDNNFQYDADLTVTSAGIGKGFIPQSRAREGTAQFSIDLPVGFPYVIKAEDGRHTWVYEWDGAYFQGPYTTIGSNACSAYMTPEGQSVTVNLYYKCMDVAC